MWVESRGKGSELTSLLHNLMEVLRRSHLRCNSFHIGYCKCRSLPPPSAIRRISVNIRREAWNYNWYCAVSKLAIADSAKVIATTIFLFHVTF